MMSAVVVLSSVVLTIVVGVISLIIVTTSERFSRVGAKIKKLEGRIKKLEAKEPRIKPVSGKARLNLGGTSRVVDVEFVPTSTAVSERRVRDRPITRY